MKTYVKAVRPALNYALMFLNWERMARDVSRILMHWIVATFRKQ